MRVASGGRAARRAALRAPLRLARSSRYVGQLSRTLRKTFGDGPPDPEDMSHLAFQKVIERGDVASIKNLKAFVWRTVCNLTLKEKRRQDVRSRHEFDIEQLFSDRR